MRTANAIDFWRGLALIMIFIDHVPGNYYANWTLQNFAISDAAELFVFLAGWSLSIATGGPHKPESPRRTVFRLLSRAIELYRAQLVVTAIALALLAGAAITRNNPLYVEWNNAGPAFYDPLRTTVGWVLMTHQLHFVDILPMYVILLLIAPLQIVLARRNRMVALALSFAVYVTALVVPFNLPSWPLSGGWFFNPFCWQLLLMLGFLAAESAAENPEFDGQISRWFLPALAVVAAGTVVKHYHYAPDPFVVPWPRYVFLFDKTYLSPVRLISLLALVVTFRHAYRTVAPFLGSTAERLCALGRNSLAVFCVGSLLSLFGQIVHFIVGGGLLIDTIVVVCGLVGMGLTAWFVEWRARLRPESASRPQD